MKSHAAELGGGAAAGPRHHLAAPTRDGTVHAVLPADPAAWSPALDAARALGASEAAWRALEAWLDAPLRPEPAASGRPPPAGTHAVFAEPASGAEFHLPMAALRRAGPPPPDDFAAWRWQPLRCDLVLDTVPLAPPDRDALASGALLLLPAAFGATWQGVLLPRGAAGTPFGAQLQEQRGRLRVAAQGQGAPRVPDDHATVRFVHPLAATPPQLFGWGPQRAAALDAPQLAEADMLMLHASAMEDACPLATGQLVPVGSGYAMRLGRCFPTVPSAPASSPALLDATGAP